MIKEITAILILFPFLAALCFGFISTLKDRDVLELVNRLERMAHLAELDFAGIVTEDGRTLCRIGPYSISNDTSQPENPEGFQIL